MNPVLWFSGVIFLACGVLSVSKAVSHKDYDIRVLWAVWAISFTFWSGWILSSL